MPDLITLGETMVAFTPNTTGPLRYVQNYGMRIAGAESNVAIGVSKLGVSTGWISKLGNDEFGKFILNSTRAEGVDCSKVIFDDEHKTGIMFKEINAGKTKVYYYRENSAASSLSPKDLDESYFEQAKILHMTGITPVLSKSCMETVSAAFDIAIDKKIMISFDPNIRRKLWKTTDYSDAIRKFTLKSSIVLIGLDEAEQLFKTRNSDKIFDIILNNNPKALIAIKDGANGAIVADENTRKHIKAYPCKCVETVGAGDAFNAGFLSGVLKDKSIEICGKMGAIAGAMVTENYGDVEGQPSFEQMEAALNNKSEIYR